MIWGYIRTQASTTLHKFWVARNILAWIWSDWKLGYFVFSSRNVWAEWLGLLWRALVHDLSKYRWDEAKAFAATIDQLRTTTYGEPDYEAMKAKIMPAIERHYSRNRHHPEFHPGGFAEMTRVDKIEMVADWGAAVRRHDDGDLDRSLTTNAGRFSYGVSDEAFLRATAKRMGLL